MLWRFSRQISDTEVLHLGIPFHTSCCHAAQLDEHFIVHLQAHFNMLVTLNLLHLNYKNTETVYFQHLYFCQKVIRCIYCGSGYDEGVVWMWLLWHSCQNVFKTLLKISLARRSLKKVMMLCSCHYGWFHLNSMLGMQKPLFSIWRCNFCYVLLT